MKALNANDLQQISEFKSLLSAKSELIQQILNRNEATGYSTIIFEHTEDILGALESVLEDNTEATENEKYLGEFKYQQGGMDFYIEANEVGTADDKVFYYGKAAVDVNGKLYRRDWSCEASVFQGQVNGEFVRRID